MAINLGAKEPKREISLGRFGSFVFVGIFLMVMLSLAWILATTFLIGDDYGETYIKCKDGAIEKIQEGTFEYCGEYVGTDTVQGVRDYLTNINNVGINPDFNINLDEDLGLVELEE